MTAPDPHPGSGHLGAAGLIWACAVVMADRPSRSVPDAASPPQRRPYTASGFEPAVVPVPPGAAAGGEG